jgi:hypothetical protein
MSMNILQEAFLNPETSLVCVDCGITYTMTDKEYSRFKDLAKNIANFKMPRRCAQCRKVRRENAGRLQQAYVRPGVRSTTAPDQPISHQAPHRRIAQPAERNETLVILSTDDFESLVNGQPVIWNGVRVVLAQIGFQQMRKLIDEAELEKAKKLVKANGH